MKIKKENKKDALYKAIKIDKSEDLREFKHNEYDTIFDLNKKPTKDNDELKSLNNNDDEYNLDEMLIETKK